MQSDFVSIRISDDGKSSIPGESDLRFLYVYEGKARLQSGSEQIQLEKDEFYAINPGDNAMYSMERSGFVGILRLNHFQIEKYLEMKQYRIFCSSAEDQGAGVERIGTYLRSIFGNALGDDPSRKALVLSEAYELLYLLRENFRVPKNEPENAKQEDEYHRIETIRNYLMENYYRKISLEDLSEETFLSIAYLSKYIKRSFGANFSEVLLNIRMEHALEDLLNTDHTLTAVALDNGFSSQVIFSRCFRERYGMIPSEYRRKHQTRSTIKDGEEQSEYGHSETDSRLKQIVEERSRDQSLQSVNYRELTAKVSEARGYTRFWSKMMNGGVAHGLLRADMQEHILLIHKELGVEHIRIWDLGAPELMLYDGNPDRRYNFNQLDRVMEFLLKNGMHPYLELGPKPNILLANSENYLVSQKRSRLADTLEQFGEFAEALVRHYVERYGAEEIEKWYFELWMETDSFNTEEYLQVFGLLNTYMRNVLPGIRLGGPGISNENNTSFDKLMHEWETEEQKPDQVTYYVYPYVLEAYHRKSPNHLPETAARDRSSNFVNRQIRENTEILHECGFWDQKVHITEWNSSVSNRNVVNDSVYKGAYVVRNLLAMFGHVDLAGYWLASDLFAEYYDTQKLLSGSGGLLTRDGIRKPAFYGISFLNRLEKYLLALSEEAVITASARGSYSIVCHNYRHPTYKYFSTPEDELRIKEYRSYFDQDKREFHFRIEGVKDGLYEVKTRVIDEHHGSVQDEWIRMGLTDHLNEQDLEYLRRICVPHISIETLEVAGGVMEIRSVLESNAIKHIHIYRIS
jgi:beta-xylosidase/AraC-like DNA-binding protein